MAIGHTAVTMENTQKLVGSKEATLIHKFLTLYY